MSAVIRQIGSACLGRSLAVALSPCGTLRKAIVGVVIGCGLVGAAAPAFICSLGRHTRPIQASSDGTGGAGHAADEAPSVL